MYLKNYFRRIPWILKYPLIYLKKMLNFTKEMASLTHIPCFFFPLEI